MSRNTPSPVSPLYSIPLTAGHLSGRAIWDDRLQSFAAILQVFDDTGPSYPPTAVRYGSRFAEHITTDSLTNQLMAVGLRPSSDSLRHLFRLGGLVEAAVGPAELVGLVGSGGHRSLHVLTPAGALVEIQPRFGHDDYRHRWGDASVATIETARLVCEAAWVRRPEQDIEAFALALTVEVLASIAGDFSLSAPTLCDWFLCDDQPSTTLGPDQLALVRGRLGLASGDVLAAPVPVRVRPDRRLHAE